MALEFEGRVKVVSGNVTEAQVVGKAIEAAEAFGSLDSVVANAGVLDPVAAVGKASVAQWRELFEVNLFSVVELVSQALPHLEKSNGRFVAVSSGASTKAYYGWSAYGASKAGLNQLVQAVASENENVSAIAVAPGVVDTEMQRDIREKFGKKMTPESLKRFTDLHENNGLLPPEVPARVYANLATRGWSSEMDGGYYRVGDKELEPFTK